MSGPRRVLHVLSQRPLLTGSGVTLDALVRLAAEAGWEQRVVVGAPDDPGSVGGLPADRVHPLRFGAEGSALPFPVPGMSDVMPYESTVFSTMTAGMRSAYRAAWREHLTPVIESFAPGVIHAHHAWILSSLIAETWRSIPVVVHGHGTALRQMRLCPDVAEEVREGLGAVARYVVLHEEHAAAYAEAIGVPRERCRVVGAGYREDVFHGRGRAAEVGLAVLYAGKLAASKGLPSLLAATEALRAGVPDLVLHVAGGGAGEEADRLRARVESQEGVEFHGRLPQPALADLARRCAVFVLPSFYEGLPLVLVEALACGCNLVSTALPGVMDGLAPHLGPALRTVPLPRLRTVDEPAPEDLPSFEARLAAAIRDALAAPPPEASLARPFTWRAVFERIESVWRDLTAEV